MHLARVLSATCRNAVKQRGAVAVGPSLPAALQQQRRHQSGQQSGQLSGQQSGLADFFEQGRTPDASVTTGRGWQAWELRHKSFEDLHGLWYVLLKEKNLLYSQKQMLQSQGRRMVQPHRIRLVKASMCRIKQSTRSAPLRPSASSPHPFVRARVERAMAAQRAPPSFRLRAYYGIDFPGKVTLLVAQSLLSFALAATLFGRYAVTVNLVRRFWPLLPAQLTSFLVGFSAALALLLAFAYSLTLSANLRTSLLLRPRLARHMLALVPAWQPVRTALDLGSGRGVLLASLGLQLLECGGEGRAIGFDSWETKSRAAGGGANGGVKGGSRLEVERSRALKGADAGAGDADAGDSVSGGAAGGADGASVDAGATGSSSSSSGRHVRHRRADKAKAGHPGRSSAGTISPAPAAAAPASGLAAVSAAAVGSMAGALRAAAREGVGALVTCKTGAFDRLPFPDSYFDVVISALRLHAIASYVPCAVSHVPCLMCRVSCAVSHVPCLMCRVSCAVSHVPCLMCRVSCAVSHVPCLMCRVSCAVSHVPCLMCRVSCAVSHVPCLMCRVSCAVSHVPCLMCRVSCAVSHVPCLMCRVSCAVSHVPCLMCRVSCAVSHVPSSGAAGSESGASKYILLSPTPLPPSLDPFLSRFPSCLCPPTHMTGTRGHRSTSRREGATEGAAAGGESAQVLKPGKRVVLWTSHSLSLFPPSPVPLLSLPHHPHDRC
ncbi:unnamed protein product [Closterium sp. Naga37s-1]|nr:unnamed protein product [Closterium sp. Naga37s-1]